MIRVRQHLINGFGQKVEKVKTVQGELGSGIRDTSGKEIFVNDIIEGEYIWYGGVKLVKGIVDFGPNGFFVRELESDDVYALTELIPATVVGQKDRL